MAPKNLFVCIEERTDNLLVLSPLPPDFWTSIIQLISLFRDNFAIAPWSTDSWYLNMFHGSISENGNLLTS